MICIITINANTTIAQPLPHQTEIVKVIRMLMLVIRMLLYVSHIIKISRMPRFIFVPFKKKQILLRVSQNTDKEHR